MAGDPRERGLRYGAGAADRVRRSVRGYEETFRRKAGWDWSRSRREAARFLPAIAETAPAQIEEMHGIAEGAGLEFHDVLAINVRTEILGRARVEACLAPSRSDGCTAVAVLPQASGGPTIVAQNWDWLERTRDAVVVLEVTRDDGPDYVTVVEAGLLAKAGMNSAGLALCTNFLLTEDDLGSPGVPYHVILRALLDAESLPQAVATLHGASRASSANYLLAHADGVAVDVEAAPGGPEALTSIEPDQGLMVHANHFRGDGSTRDLAPVVAPCSRLRERRLEERLRERLGSISREDVQMALTDHVGFPASVCYHPDLELEPADRDVTAASIVMDLDARQLAVAPGNPCEAAYEVIPA